MVTMGPSLESSAVVNTRDDSVDERLRKRRRKSSEEDVSNESGKGGNHDIELRQGQTAESHDSRKDTDEEVEENVESKENTETDRRISNNGEDGDVEDEDVEDEVVESEQDEGELDTGEEDEGEHHDGNEHGNEAAVDSGVKSEAAGGRNIARARSAWMLFLAENREKARGENPNMAIGPLQKILSERWKSLTEDETARYTKMAMEDKARLKRELQEAGLSKLPAKSTPTPDVTSPTSLVLPIARVRKTVRLDPAVGNISKEGLHLVTKATEVFMAFMAEKAWRVGRQTGRKSVKPCDVADFVFAAPEMYWLREEFRSERSSVKKSAGRIEASGKISSGKKASRPVAKGAGAITSFFKKT